MASKQSNVEIAAEKSARNCKGCGNCTCDCECCAKVCARMRKIHPVFATIVFVVVIAIGFGILGAFAKTQNDEIANLKTQISQLQTTAIANSVRENGVQYDGENGKTALELLKKSHQVEVKDYGDMGQMVIAIDGAKATDGQFWAFFVDGAMATEGASTYETKDGGKIEWRLENIQ